jgi:hypothetical protein
MLKMDSAGEDKLRVFNISGFQISQELVNESRPAI